MITTINGLRIHHHGARASVFLKFLLTCHLPPIIARRFARVTVGRFE